MNELTQDQIALANRWRASTWFTWRFGMRCASETKRTSKPSELYRVVGYIKPPTPDILLSPSETKRVAKSLRGAGVNVPGSNWAVRLSGAPRFLSVGERLSGPSHADDSGVAWMDSGLEFASPDITDPITRLAIILDVRDAFPLAPASTSIHLSHNADGSPKPEWVCSYATEDGWKQATGPTEFEATLAALEAAPPKVTP